MVQNLIFPTNDYPDMIVMRHIFSIKQEQKKDDIGSNVHVV